MVTTSERTVHNDEMTDERKMKSHYIHAIFCVHLCELTYQAEVMRLLTFRKHPSVLLSSSGIYLFIDASLDSFLKRTLELSIV